MIPFAAYDTAETPMLFIGQYIPQNFPFPCGISTQLFLGSYESAPKWQLDQFSHFAKLMEVNRQTRYS